MGQWNSGKVPLQKGVLLSGPPGIGKSLAAATMCREFGFDVVEFNASDARSKSDLDASVATLVKAQNVGEFFAPRSSNSEVKKTCIVMDEVDGMSSGDRGGMTRLLQLIDATKVPIICICNDRSNPKLRALKSRCEDIPFSRPTAAQALPRLRNVVRQEKLDVDEDRLALLFTSTNGDLRQTLNLLQWTSLKTARSSTDEVARKDVDLGAFDVLPQLWDSNADLSTKLEYYDVDSSMVPLLVQENYLGSLSSQSRPDDLGRYARAADSISDGDLINRTIHEHSNWSLYEIHGMVSTVAPCVYAPRANCFRISFPGWLAKYAPTQRRERLLREMSTDMALCVSATRAEVRLDYLSPLRQRLVGPMERQGERGISQVVGIMNAYSLSREDWDSVVELTTLAKGVQEPKIDSKVKTKFTREYKRLRPLSRFSKENKTSKAQRPSDEEDSGAFEEGDANEEPSPPKPLKRKSTSDPTASKKKSAPKKSAKK